MIFEPLLRYREEERRLANSDDLEALVDELSSCVASMRKIG